MSIARWNLNRAYKSVMRNKGCGGIDGMSCEHLLSWLLANKETLTRSLQDGSYLPNPVRRVEIPKEGGKMRLLGIPTVVDRLVQQAINQVLTPIYEKQFSHWCFGFRPGKGCHDALRGAQRIVDEGYKYVVDLDLDRFFDPVCHIQCQLEKGRLSLSVGFLSRMASKVGTAVCRTARTVV